MEPSSAWANSQCEEDVSGDGCRIVWRVSKAVLREGSQGLRVGREEGVNSEEIGSSGCTSREGWYGFG